MQPLPTQGGAMAWEAHYWRQAAIEFDLNILVHDPELVPELGLRGREGGSGEQKNPHTFFQFLKGNLTRAIEQRKKK